MLNLKLEQTPIELPEAQKAGTKYLMNRPFKTGCSCIFS